MFVSIENSRVLYLLQILPKIIGYVCSISSHKNATLVMLRIGIGLGWLISGFSKLSDPVWHSGDTLAAFLQMQLATNSVYTPLYETLITDWFLPNIVELSWIVMMGEWAVGLALISGTLTTSALFFGFIMNINMILAGMLSPAIIYAVIQVVLYFSDGAKIFSIDALLSKYKHSIIYIIVPSDNRKRLTRAEDREPTRLDSTPPLEPNIDRPTEADERSNARTDHGSASRPFFQQSKDIFVGGSMKDSNLFNSH